MNDTARLFSVAPMMDWTDRHCRVFHRQMTKHALLYTEMVTALAIRHGDRQRLLGFDPLEQPVALQIGGSDPTLLAEAAKWGEDYGYCEINLNVGCPSDRVQSGRFGACLMAEPALVRDCLGAMRQAVRVPVTIKCRIGIDDQDEEDDFTNFIGTVMQSGVTTFIVHARKAWLKGLSPKENREVPPLNYRRVYGIKQKHNGNTIIINGGINTIDDALEHLKHIDGVMLGRAAYNTPWLLSEVDSRIYGGARGMGDPLDVVERMKPYISKELEKGVWLQNITRHMLGLFHGRPGGRLWRRVLSEQAPKPGAGIEVLKKAAKEVADRINRPAAGPPARRDASCAA
ncbi:tRNA dihydrouridine(20/20a) synthase DusA [Aestuariivirga sp.]|uniref:tRNA dihydrouridine(20/20a) synthase DusA n=1 Tax=Aestuariivirga sp. TaxID=2650926 RepID=UPI0025BE2B44|nr:tRNA dihydrouridine(20/20a) synthase DusA [Aestuariivirga sp.]MCA3556352.1 tRNA dihydrouridine(20/20a) synthase DusA [Aestuariivirga sp.]